MTQQSEVIGNEKYIPILNAGFVGLVDHMGDDNAIVQAARVSYGKGTKKISEDRGLIRYLLRHAHTTPFEMVEFKFHCKMPIFVARQWIRHRTASVNEYSGRYSEMSEDMFSPDLETIKPQSTDNKQGRDGTFSDEQKEDIKFYIDSNNISDQQEYQKLLSTGLAKEMARGVLSVNNYTEAYWKIDLHNLFHFLKLRLDAHAQYEIRELASAMYKLIQPIVPIACEAFEDYIFDFDSGTYQNYHISKAEQKMLIEIIDDWVFMSGRDHNAYVETYMKDYFGASKREIEDFKSKFFKNIE